MLNFLSIIFIQLQLYDSIEEIRVKTGANVIFIPRYESDHLKKEFPECYVIEEKIIVQHLLAYASLFIGGGGTLNTEACFFGTPTISTRSFISHYDKFQIDNGLMYWVSTKDELVSKSVELFGKKYDEKAKDVFEKMEVEIDFIVDNILNHQEDKKQFSMFDRVD